MGLHHRKILLSDSVKQLCSSLCPRDPPHPPPLVESRDDYPTQTPSSSKHIKISTYLIISFSVVAAISIVALCCYAIYVKFFSTRNRTTRTLSRPQTQHDLLEEDHPHGPAVDHPIWYIRTAGLHQAVIGAITVCKYRKDEGLIEGTECSVCLSEFQEDESLRLLPKCNHAFHLPCIDTWLTSHTNCPMCRAPIVTDPTRIPSFRPSTSFVQDLHDLHDHHDHHHHHIEENEQDYTVEEQNEIPSSHVLTVQPRRSVSLDSSSAAKITLALETLQSRESLSHSKRVLGNVKRSRSFNARHLLSWYSRSQTKSNPPLRSF